jgi:hypothetical protein
LTDWVVADFSKIGTIHINFGTVQTKMYCLSEIG